MTAPSQEAPPADSPSPERSQARLLFAFAAVYIIWGSTYLAIRVAVETLPPFLMAGTRFLIAGAAMIAWTRSRGAVPPTKAHWRTATIVGGCLLLGGNGGVVWAEQRVPSSLAALLVSMTPIWMVLLEWARPRGTRPGRMALAGLCAGFAGVALLVGPSHGGARDLADPVGTLALLIASFSWAVGSLIARNAPLPDSPMLATGMEMLMGGVWLLAAGLLTGEWSRVQPQQFSGASMGAFLYLIVFGSFIGFSSYVYLLRTTTVARASTYAYVNPVVAVFLGWIVLHEAITLRTLAAAGVIVASVALITVSRPAPAPQEKLTPLEEPALPGDA